MIYLDSAATTFQKPRSVKAAVTKALDAYSSPGRGGYKPAMDAAEELYRCRELAARLFNVPDVERVAVTFNATHGLNIAIRSLVRPGDRVVISGYEHNSVLRPLHALGADIAVASSPLFDSAAALSAFEFALRGGAACAVVTHVSNVFGFELPIGDIAALCRARSVPLIVDASQSAGVLAVDFRELGADFIAMPGHKGLYGPQGTGLLLVSGEASPLIYGGSGSNSISPDMPPFLPDMLEAGTHNMPGVAGLSAGLEFVLRTGPENIAAREKHLMRRMAEGLSGLGGLRLFTASDTRHQTGVMSFTLDAMGSEEAGERLGEMGFAVRAGLHCAPLAHKTVGTVRTGTVRASVSYFNTEAEIDAFIDAVRTLTRRS